MIAFGPVPSRRLGRSLGINNIPPKLGYALFLWAMASNAFFAEGVRIQTECGHTVVAWFTVGGGSHRRIGSVVRGTDISGGQDANERAARL
ncbi:MAG: hypothetical protein JW934_14160 [Anaerolineae bacterium]|nr:hypothetical protein [Anaerolineae bacterium]